MAEYPDGRVVRLAKSLRKARVAPEVCTQILAGAEDLPYDNKSARNADWFRDAMQRMDALLPEETRYSVREACACCLGGKREEITKDIAKHYATLEERIAAANEARFVFGHSVTQQPDGSIRVCFFPEGATNLSCSCLGGAKEPMPITYCYCCGGYVKKHLQTALGRKLEVKVIATVLSSGGKEGCTFDLALVD